MPESESNVGPHQRIIHVALQVMQTKERLAVALGISEAELDAYFKIERMPHQVFMDAVDIVAGTK